MPIGSNALSRREAPVSRTPQSVVLPPKSFFTISEISKLAPQSQQPFVLTLNCLNGYFQFPYFNSLAEELVKAEGRGAIAAFSPSGLSLDEPAQYFHRAVLRELLSGKNRRLGDLAAQTTPPPGSSPSSSASIISSVTRRSRSGRASSSEALPIVGAAMVLVGGDPRVPGAGSACLANRRHPGAAVRLVRSRFPGPDVIELIVVISSVHSRLLTSWLHAILRPDPNLSS